MTDRVVRYTALAAGTVLAVSSLTAASAAAGRSFDTACADNKNGHLRVLLNGGTCSPKEQSIGLGAPSAPGHGLEFHYLDRRVIVPASAYMADADYRAECPAGTHILNGNVRSLTRNAWWNLGSEYVDERDGSSALVFRARHVNPSAPPLGFSEDAAADAVAVVRIVCAGRPQ